MDKAEPTVIGENKSKNTISPQTQSSDLTEQER